jgi:ABC-type dipeptide/oligopeptide/nickel transport system ATPase component
VDEIYENPAIRTPSPDVFHSPVMRPPDRLVTIEGPSLVAFAGGLPSTTRCTYRIPRCEEENPPREVITPNHDVACWVAQQGDI